MESLFFLLVAPFYILAGLWFLITKPFAWVFAIVVIAMFATVYMIWKKQKDFSVMIIPSLTLFGLSLSTWLSDRPLDYALQTMTAYSTAGFPIRNFAYPISPMGSDDVPLSMWGGFYLNMLFWLVVAVAIWFLISRSSYKKWVTEKLILWLNVIATVLLISGFGYLLFQFD
ncbi:MAG: hypothetical protein KIH65_004725 [Candidatus Uhrbacteria bacterium]|nr:hypothetical protein [Candidatus Uhrbacteria bacterium]